MAHFAELNSNNIVQRVLVIDNNILIDEDGISKESVGIKFLQSLFGNETIWKKTSYNTKGGIYFDSQTNEPATDQSKAFRKNYAGIGYEYNEKYDAFINPKPIVSKEMEQYVSFNESSCLWEFNPPIPQPMEIVRV